MRTTLIITIFAIFLLGLVACSSEEDHVESEDLDNVNESGMPIVDDPIDLDIFAREAVVSNDDWNDVLVFNEYEDMTNVNTNFNMVSDNVMEEKLNLTLGGGDLPDVFHTTFISDGDMTKYGEQGTFIPLNDLIDEYAPNLKKILDENPVIEKQITFPDGNIYGLPKITDEDFLSYRTKEKPWINEEWLDNLGMDMPETTEDFYDYLKAVKEGDPTGDGDDDIVPYGGREIEPLFDYLKGSFGVANKGTNNENIDVDPDSGELRFFPTSDDYKELLEYMHKLYSEELIAENIFSIEDEQYRADVGDGKYGSTVFFNPVVSVGGENVDEFTGMSALEGPDGEKEFVTLEPEVDNKSAFVITDENEHPAASMRWADYFYGDEGMELFFMGVEGETFEYDDDGDPEYVDEIKESDDIVEAQSDYLTFQGGGFPSVTTEDFFQGTAESSEESVEAAEELEPDLVDDPWPPFIYTDDERDDLDTFGEDIEKYVNEMRDKFISGEESLNDWEDYVANIEKMHLDDYMEIKEDALERFEDN